LRISSLSWTFVPKFTILKGRYCRKQKQAQ
jgi:hypothetical protein